ncbi:hypothetical protein FQA39_LY04962 [Lamprigera yunnana]|nr:hypothetical protein FQA39_LY04962 [Lamprigera yunnana]
MLLFLLLVSGVHGANILHISHISSGSHHIWNRPLAFNLVKKGHNVTMLSRQNEKSKPTNFTLILLEDTQKETFDSFSINNLEDIGVFASIKVLYGFSEYWCVHDFATDGLRTLMNYPKDFKFDLIIYDITLQQCLYPLIHRFNNPPVVAVTPFLLPPVLSHALGNPLQPSYFPYYATRYSDKMNFRERLYNFLYVYYELFYRKFISTPIETKLAKEYFGENIPPFEEVERNISILLCNTDPNLEYPLDLPPNVIPVGGLQIQPPKPLPQDLQKIADDAKHGFIVFSLGSNFRSDSLSEDKIRTILNAFSKLPQTIIWKFESDTIKKLPENVVIKKWLPQSDLLAHPNIKLLINHGGGLSTQEAMSYGVPVIAIPFYGDQFANAGRLQKKKMAKVVIFKTLSTNSFYRTIKEMLDNPTYRNNIKTLSRRYNDRLNTPLEIATFWVEYVLRHGGAEHLSLAARNMYFYESNSLDMFVVLVLAIFLLYKLSRLLFLTLKNVFATASKKTKLD